ncbi:hypothetical protein VNO77_37319 [Canavalia gladiata]|uniref:Uncharacterized protein n=1 Tax=Canavalia gladiata TaxID=3824 RepID=A0AAN9K8T8_CANGL
MFVRYKANTPIFFPIPHSRLILILHFCNGTKEMTPSLFPRPDILLAPKRDLTTVAQPSEVLDPVIRSMQLANEGNLDGIRELLDVGSYVNFRDTDDRTALHIAASPPSASSLCSWLRYGGSPSGEKVFVDGEGWPEAASPTWRGEWLGVGPTILELLVAPTTGMKKSRGFNEEEPPYANSIKFP